MESGDVLPTISVPGFRIRSVRATAFATLLSALRPPSLAGVAIGNGFC